jgi:hypothetical protein
MVTGEVQTGQVAIRELGRIWSLMELRRFHQSIIRIDVMKIMTNVTRNAATILGNVKLTENGRAVSCSKAVASESATGTCLAA